MDDYIKKTLKAYEDTDKFESSTKDLVAVNEIEKFIVKLPKNAKVLDAGCAFGRDTRYLSSKGFDVVGIDLSKELIARAKELSLHIDFSVQDIRKTNFEDNSFDGIWSSATLLHLKDEDLEIALKELARILKPKGVLAITFKKGNGTKVIVDKFSSDSERFYNFQTHESLLTKLEKAGLQEVDWFYINEREMFGPNVRDLTWLYSYSKKM